MRGKGGGQRGFSLIELAIVIAIIGMISVTSLQFLGGSLRNAQARATQDRLDLAVEAVLAFYAENSRLPCPADGDLGPGDTGYGLEDSPCSSGNDAANLATGVLPWRTLGLPELSAQDGWTRMLSYRAAPGLTVAGGSIGSNAPTVRYQDQGAGGAAVAFLVMSHGSNGLGANTQAGTRLTTGGAGTSELENGDGDREYVARAQTPPPNDAYDDLLVWRTRAQVAQTLGIYPGNICTSAVTVASTYNCSGSPTDANACAVAAAVQARCP